MFEELTLTQKMLVVGLFLFWFGECIAEGFGYGCFWTGMVLLIIAGIRWLWEIL